MGDKGQTGFTLIELLAVLAIVGLAAAAVVLAIPDRAGLVREAERFAARAKAAQDSAVLEARPARVVVSPVGYSIERRSGGEWRAAARHDWPEGMTAEPAGAAMFDPTGLAEPMRLVLRSGGDEVAVEIGHDGAASVRR